MQNGKIGIFTSDVIGLSNFYKLLLGVDNENYK